MGLGGPHLGGLSGGRSDLGDSRETEGRKSRAAAGGSVCFHTLRFIVSPSFVSFWFGPTHVLWSSIISVSPSTSPAG